jgi:hypothetical protein
LSYWPVVSGCQPLQNLSEQTASVYLVPTELTVDAQILFGKDFATPSCDNVLVKVFFTDICAITLLRNAYIKGTVA